MGLGGDDEIFFPTNSWFLKESLKNLCTHITVATSRDYFFAARCRYKIQLIKKSPAFSVTPHNLLHNERMANVVNGRRTYATRSIAIARRSIAIHAIRHTIIFTLAAVDELFLCVSQ